MSYKSNNFLIILIAPSGGGKSSILREVLARRDDISYSISYTTRAPRGKEINGVDYYFVSEKEFENMKEREDLLEFANVHGNWYGTSLSFINKLTASGKHVLMDIDVQGACQIQNSNIDAVTIFIIPPTQKELVERLVRRGTECKESIEKRLHNGKGEIAEINHFDYLVVNDNFDKSVTEVLNIINVEEKKIKRFNDIEEIFYGG